MTHSKSATAVLGASLTLLILLPALLFAQTDDNTEEASIPTENGTSTSDTNNTRPATRNGTQPPRPVERNAEAIKPAKTNNTGTTTNPIARPSGQGALSTQQRTTDTSKRPSLEERKAQMEAKRLELQSNQIERRTALQENSQKRIANFGAAMSNRMENAIARIASVIARIESRVEKSKAQGADTSEAERYLALAKENLQNAAAVLTTLDTEIVNVVTSEDPKTAWSEVRTTYQEVRDAIRLAHENIKNAVTSLKESMRVREVTNPDIETAGNAE